MTKTKNDKEDILEKDPAEETQTAEEGSCEEQTADTESQPKRERKHPAAKRLHRKRLKSR